MTPSEHSKQSGGREGQQRRLEGEGRVIERKECPECRAAFGERHGEGCSVRAARLHAGDWEVVCNLDRAIVDLLTVRYVEEVPATPPSPAEQLTVRA